MKKLGIAAIVVGGLAAGVLSIAPPAQATTQSAAEIIKSLQAAGYDVRINGSVDVPLSQCNVIGTHGLNNSNVNSINQRIDNTEFDTAYVDVSCPG